jgi:hypothetical protein
LSARDITNKGSKKIIGKFPSYLMGIIVMWESKLERDFLYLLEFDLDVLSYTGQPMRILYSCAGKVRRYTPDFLVVRKHKRQIIEVKPLNRVSKGDNEQRFRIISQVCRTHGYEFKIVTDANIRVQPRLDNIKLLWKYARTPFHPQHQIYCKALLGGGKEICLGEVIQVLESKGVSRQIIYSMMYHKVLAVDLMRPITADSVVQLTGAMTSETQEL